MEKLDNYSSQPDVYQEISFLSKTVRILFINKDEQIIRKQCSKLRECLIYDVHSAKNFTDAEKLINKYGRYHVCICDLGIQDKGDQLYLLKKYASKIPFMIYSTNNCLVSGFEAHKFGAKEIISDPVNFVGLMSKVNYLFLNSIASRGDMVNQSDIIKTCIATLLEHSPNSITEWARLTGIAESYLRRIWSDCYQVQPKYVLYLFNMYVAAFSYYTDFSPLKSRIELIRKFKRYYLDNIYDFQRVMA